MSSPQPETICHRVFPTCIFQRDWDGDLPERLQSVILGYKAANPEGIYRSNAAGTWHSDDRLLRWAGDAGEQLTSLFRTMFVTAFENMAHKKGGRYKLRLGAWAMVSKDRGYATVHTHPNCHMSGVYYVKESKTPKKLVMATGVKVSPGEIEFVDTRGAGQMTIPGLSFSPAARCAPKEGRMLVFPSWLPHFVHPVLGKDTRISVACNCTIIAYEPPKETPKDES